MPDSSCWGSQEMWTEVTHWPVCLCGSLWFAWHQWMQLWMDSELSDDGQGGLHWSSRSSRSEPEGFIKAMQTWSLTTVSFGSGISDDKSPTRCRRAQQNYSRSLAEEDWRTARLFRGSFAALYVVGWLDDCASCALITLLSFIILYSVNTPKFFSSHVISSPWHKTSCSSCNNFNLTC